MARVIAKLSIIEGFYWGFPGSSALKNSPAMQETPVQFLGREDPPEKREATHSSILGFSCGKWKKEQTPLDQLLRTVASFVRKLGFSQR